MRRGLGVAQREDYSIHCENVVVHVFRWDLDLELESFLSLLCR
jgi:hypothetical protein